MPNLVCVSELKPSLTNPTEICQTYCIAGVHSLRVFIIILFNKRWHLKKKITLTTGNYSKSKNCSETLLALPRSPTRKYGCTMRAVSLRMRNASIKTRPNAKPQSSKSALRMWKIALISFVAVLSTVQGKPCCDDTEHGLFIHFYYHCRLLPGRQHQTGCSVMGSYAREANDERAANWKVRRSVLCYHRRRN